MSSGHHSLCRKIDIRYVEANYENLRKQDCPYYWEVTRESAKPLSWRLPKKARMWSSPAAALLKERSSPRRLLRLVFQVPRFTSRASSLLSASPRRLRWSSRSRASVSTVSLPARSKPECLTTPLVKARRRRRKLLRHKRRLAALAPRRRLPAPCSGSVHPVRDSSQAKTSPWTVDTPHNSETIMDWRRRLRPRDDLLATASRTQRRSGAYDSLCLCLPVRSIIGQIWSDNLS
jgi:hypothetical protein